MISRDLVGGLAASLIGAVYLYFAYQLRVSALDDSLGPAGMPRIYGWLLVALGLTLVAQAVIASLMRGRRTDSVAEWEGQGRRLAWAVGLFVIGTIYLFFVETLGYLIAVGLLILATASYLGASAGVRLMAVAGFGALLLWALFTLVLGVSMPTGVLSAVGL